MEKTKIFLANYPKVNQTALFSQIGGSEELEVFSGFDLNPDSKDVTLSIARDLITALLTYDEVYILGNNVLDVAQVWGLDNLEELSRSGIVRAIPDLELNPVLKRKKGGKWQPDFFSYANGSEDRGSGERVLFEGKLGHVENRLFKRGVCQTERNRVLYLLEDNLIKLDPNSIRPLILKETGHDINSIDYLSDREFYRINSGILEYNMLSFLRLHHLNTMTAIAATLHVDGMKTDGEISKLMQKKTQPFFANHIPNGVDAMTSISQKKGFPDLGQLFIDSIIGLEDILKLRDSFQGRRFRCWAKLDDYEEHQMQQDVMNTVNTVLGSRIASTVRMAFCNVIGLAGFIPGVAASVIDSFILKEIARGWHPNMFLDEKLKKLIDTKVSEQDKLNHNLVFSTRFSSVGRNDLCPCGSGKKFKNCCGR